MSAITTHVLDTSRGKPAIGVRVALEAQDAQGAWAEIGKGRTDRDGRVREGLSLSAGIDAGTYRLRFDTGAWFREQGIDGLWPEVVVAFAVRHPGDHHHVPLLLSPFGYSTYRGS